MHLIIILTALIFLLLSPITGKAEDQQDFSPTDLPISSHTIFDDKMLILGYAEKYSAYSLDTIVEMMKDDALASFNMTAAIRIFRIKHSLDVDLKEKRAIEKILLRRLNRTDSPFVQVETMHTLCKINRYRYFGSMVPALIQKMDHYNFAVNEMAYESINDLITSGVRRTREANIIFNTLRKILFLSRKRLENVVEPNPRLKQKLRLLRWSIKVLGTDRLQKLPREVIPLL